VSRLQTRHRPAASRELIWTNSRCTRNDVRVVSPVASDELVDGLTRALSRAAADSADAGGLTTTQERAAVRGMALHPIAQVCPPHSQGSLLGFQRASEIVTAFIDSIAEETVSEAHA
jgi:hypothetical protein